MVNRNVKITVLDDDSGFLSMAEKTLRYSRELEDISFEVSGCLAEDSVQKTVRKIQGENPDVVVVDYKLRDYDGGEVATILRADNENLRMILNSGYSIVSPASSDSPFLEGVRQAAIEGLKSGLWADILEKGIQIDKMTKSVRKNIMKPLTIGVVGRSEFGAVFTSHALERPEIGKIFYHSPTFRDQPCGIIKQLELHSSSSKLEETSLEKLATESDLIVFTSSSIRGAEMVRRVKHKDKREAFEIDAPRYRDFAKVISQVNSSALICVVANPPNLLSSEMIKHGVLPEKTCSPFEPDTSRIERCGRNYEDLFEKEFLEKLKLRLTGWHGMPQIILREEERSELEEYTERLETDAALLGDEAHREAKKSGKAYLIPQLLLARSIAELAHFPVRPSTHYNVFYSTKRDGIEHQMVVAAPVRFDWKNWSVQVDNGKIDEIGKENFDYYAIPFADLEKEIRGN